MIYSAVTMVLVGAALQAAPPARAFITSVRRRPCAAELKRCLSFTPLPRRDPLLEQLIADVDIALNRD